MARLGPQVRPPVPRALEKFKRLFKNDRTLVLAKLRQRALNHEDAVTGRRSTALLTCILFAEGRSAEELRYLRAPQDILLTFTPAEAHPLIHPWIDHAHQLGVDTPNHYAFCSVIGDKPGGLLWRYNIIAKVSAFLRHCQPGIDSMIPTHPRARGGSPMPR